MKKLFIILSIVLMGSPAWAGQLKFVSMYPAPNGIFTQLRLPPQTDLNNSVCANGGSPLVGTMYMNLNGDLKICTATGGGTWNSSLNIWEKNPSYLWIKDSELVANAAWKVGIGVTNPSMKLHLKQDGGILAEGTQGSGAVLTAAGAGTRFIWYPRKSAIRAGNVGMFTDGTEWNDANIGDYSVAFGNSNKASGDTSFIGTGYQNQALGGRSVVVGGALNIVHPNGFTGSILGGFQNVVGDAAQPQNVQWFSTIGGGSGNIVVADRGTIAGGLLNEARGSHPVVGGGYDNHALAEESTVAGGSGNEAWGPGSTISGGGDITIINQGGPAHIAYGNYDTIGGGAVNISSTGGVGTGGYITISGGGGNRAAGSYATISGGQSNVANGSTAVIGGGSTNTSSGNYSSVGGGSGNYASGLESVIGGGQSNTTNVTDSPLVAGGAHAVIGGGQGNRASGPHSAIGGGGSNTAIGNGNVIAGGWSHISNGLQSVIGGGYSNNASANYSTIAGGEYGIASNVYAALGGGSQNTASGYASFLGGGKLNTASGNYSAIAGGMNNGTAAGTYAFVGAGSQNTASGTWSSLGGGNQNTASGAYASLGGGIMNVSSGNWSTVGGGSRAIATNDGTTASGGVNNSATGAYSTVPGGLNNTAAGDFSFAGGRYTQLTAAATNTVAWSFSTLAPVSIAASNSYIFYNSNVNPGFAKVGIGNLAPIYPLQFATVGTYVDALGNVCGTNIACASDERLKKNIQPLKGTLDKVLQLRGVNFEWIDAKEHNDQTGTQTGFIAQEVEKIFPEWIYTKEDGYKAINYTGFDATIVEALKELNGKITDLQNENKELREEIRSLKHVE